MKKRGLSSRIMSVLLSLMMLLSLLPTAVLADESVTKTYTKVTSADELVTGEYVMVANNGYAPGVLDGTWVTAVTVTAANDQVIDPTGGVWTLTVDKNGTILSDANGKAIAPKGGNNNGIKSGSYRWAVDFDATDETTGPVTITASCTITVKAVKDGMTDSQEAVFTYKAYHLVDNYVKTAALTGGDKVVIFNAGNGFAVTPPTISPAAASPASMARSTWNTSPSSPSSLPTAPALTG